MSKKLYGSVITVLILLSVLLVLNTNDVSAQTVTINTPPTDGLVSGDFVFDATVSGGGAPNVSNCSWHVSTDSGSTWTYFNSSENTTNTDVHFNVSFNTAGWTDYYDIQINASCYDWSNTSFSDVNTGIDVDNTAPTIGEITIIDENKICYITDSIKIKCIGNDPSSATTTIKITKPSGKTIEKEVTGAETESWTYEFKNKDTNEAGKYLVDCNVRANYGSNRTASADQKSFKVLYFVDIEEEEEEVRVAKVDISTKEKNTVLIAAKQGEVKTFTLDGITAHEMEFLEVGLTSATIEIRSDPVKITLDVGQYRNVDVDSDGTDDIKVTLKEVDAGGAAKVEVVNLEKYAEKQREERGEEVITEEEEKGVAGLWITILVILIVIAVGYYLLKGKKGKRGQVKFSKQDLGL